MDELAEIKKKLQEKIDILEYQSRLKSGKVLDVEDVDFIFSFLKKNDPETTVLLEFVKSSIVEKIKTDYISAEKTVIEVLKFYNILPGEDFINSRHQYFFSDDKKLTKKLFFSPKKLEIIKEEFKKSGIYGKISL